VAIKKTFMNASKIASTNSGFMESCILHAKKVRMQKSRFSQRRKKGGGRREEGGGRREEGGGGRREEGGGRREEGRGRREEGRAYHSRGSIFTRTRLSATNCPFVFPPFSLYWNANSIFCLYIPEQE
jgi:hypothetical protein